MSRLFSLLYGLVAYCVFLATFLYAVGFVANLFVPRSIDGPGTAPLAEAVIVDLLLLSVFAVQHSLMARPAFKRWWTTWVPHTIERSTYVLFSSVALILLFWQWRPIDATVWAVSDPRVAALAGGVSWFGWGLALVSTFLINHFELFGLRQVMAHLLGRSLPTPVFRTPILYRHVRHPLYLGFIFAFWATPVMSAGHLLFAAVTTGYILVGIWFEERDLMAQFGEQYRHYRERVGMLLPRLRS